MAQDEAPAEGQIQDGAEGQTQGDNTPEGEGAGSPPEPKEDLSGKLREYEDRLARQEERNRYLEQTARLLEENSRRQHAPREEETRLSPELAELDKTLDPLFSKRLKGHLDPLGGQLANVLDGQDSIRFELYLSRNHPEILDSEEAQNRTFQQVEQIRQQAASVYGKYLSRVDAFLYAQGLEGVKEKQKARQTKKTTQVKEEAKRQLQNQSAQSGAGSPEQRKPAGAAGVESILKRMRAGERVSKEDRAKVRDYLANVEF